MKFAMKLTMKLTMTLSLLVICTGRLEASAGPAPRFVVAAKRSLPTGLEEISVVFEGEKVDFYLNSNFALERGPKGALGHFSTPLNEVLGAEREELTAISSHPGVKLTPRDYVSPHSTQVFLQGRLLPASSPFYEGVVDGLNRIWEGAEWRAVDGVRVLIGPGGAPRASLEQGSAKRDLPKQEVDCQATDKGTRCRVNGYGFLYLAK